jgi:hypothetical protein
MKNNRMKSTAAPLVVLLVMGLLWGCSESPLAPGSSSDGPRLLVRSPDAVSHYLEASPLYAEGWILSEDGGQLSLPDVVLDVPANAVSKDTLFSILIPDAGVFFCEFGTSGLVFATPVRVTMSYSEADLNGVDESTIRIAYLNESSGNWEDLQCDVDPVNKIVVAYMDHFSRYGLISD